MKIFIILKKNIFTALFGLFLLFLVLFSKNNLSAAKEGLTLWWSCVIPSMFPFFIATELLTYTNITHIFSKFFSHIMRPLFDIPGEGAYAILMGIISGCPVGAKVVTDIYSSGLCTKEEAERMISYTNNSSPLFIIGTVGILLFRNTSIGILLFVTHILSAISVGIILGQKSKFKKHKMKSKPKINKSKLQTQDYSQISIFNFGEILSSSIKKSIALILQIGGFIVLFSVVLSILNRLRIFLSIEKVLSFLNLPKNLATSVSSGIIELTNGVKLLSNVHTKNISICIAFCSFIIGFGGISILFQVLSIISSYKLSIKTYLKGKFLQATISFIYIMIIIKACPLFNFDLPPFS